MEGGVTGEEELALVVVGIPAGTGVAVTPPLSIQLDPSVHLRSGYDMRERERERERERGGEREREG